MYLQSSRSDEELRKPQLVIPFLVWQKMMSYILNCPYEINGFGFVSKHGNVIIVDDVFILRQTVTNVHVETDQDALDDFTRALAQEKGDASSVRFQWHSHVKMAAYFSDEDLENIDRWPGDWLVSLVANQFGHYDCRLDLRRPLRLSVPLQPHISAEVPQEVTDAARDGIRSLVRMPRRIRLREPHMDTTGVTWGRPDALLLVTSDKEARS